MSYPLCQMLILDITEVTEAEIIKHISRRKRLVLTYFSKWNIQGRSVNFSGEFRVWNKSFVLECKIIRELVEIMGNIPNSFDQTFLFSRKMLRNMQRNIYIINGPWFVLKLVSCIMVEPDNKITFGFIHILHEWDGSEIKEKNTYNVGRLFYNFQSTSNDISDTRRDTPKAWTDIRCHLFNKKVI